MYHKNKQTGESIYNSIHCQKPTFLIYEELNKQRPRLSAGKCIKDKQIV